MRRKWIIGVVAAGLLAATIPAVLAVAQDGGEGSGGVTAAAVLGTSFTYQGRLSDGGQAANGSYDFEFRLFEGAVGDDQVGLTHVEEDLDVSNGLFTVGLDFGPGVFTGQQRFLEIRVRPGASAGGYQILAPRQELSATPYALSLLPGAIIQGGGQRAMLGGPTAGVLGSQMSADGTSPGVEGVTGSTAGGSFGVVGRVTATNPGAGSAGVRGVNMGEAGLGAGVWGSHAGGGRGVLGETEAGIGVHGVANGSAQANVGVLGETQSVAGIGVRAVGAGGVGKALDVVDGGVRIHGTGAPAFVHTPSTTCAAGSATAIDNPHANGDPDALLFVTPNTGGTLPLAGADVEGYQVAYNVNSLGPGFNTASPECPPGRWVIYTVSGDPFPAGVTFNVLVINR